MSWRVSHTCRRLWRQSLYRYCSECQVGYSNVIKKVLFTQFADKLWHAAAGAMKPYTLAIPKRELSAAMLGKRASVCTNPVFWYFLHQIQGVELPCISQIVMSHRLGQLCAKVLLVDYSVLLWLLNVHYFSWWIGSENGRLAIMQLEEHLFYMAEFQCCVCQQWHWGLL